MDIGHVKFIKPKHPLLQKWIKGYYVHKSLDPSFSSKVTFYQNITTTLSIYKNSYTKSNGRHREQHFKINNEYSCLLVGLVDKYQEVSFYGPLDRVAIVFYSGGLNHFVKDPLSQYLEIHFSIFNYFGLDLNTLLDKVYETNELKEKRDLLDNFFVQRFNPLQDKVLLDAIEIINDEDELLKVHDLAVALNVNRRTLLRKFRKHLGYSPEEYLSVVKFRKALYKFQETQSSLSLTDIAYDSHYYDQSDFNHNLKRRTGLTPKELFAQLNIVDNTLFWKV